jgi:hypothetical protein
MLVTLDVQWSIEKADTHGFRPNIGVPTNSDVERLIEEEVQNLFLRHGQYVIKLNHVEVVDQ